MDAEIAAAVQIDVAAAEFLLSSTAAAAFSSRFATLLQPVPAPTLFLDASNSEPRIALLRASLEQLPHPLVRLSDVSVVSALPRTTAALVHAVLCAPGSPRLRSRFGRHPDLPAGVSHLRFSVVSPSGDAVAFAALAQRHGEFTAFHGSPGAAWYSILHRGLRLVADDPAEVETGRAWGQGIYMAERLSIAEGFATPARIGDKWAGDGDVCAVGAFRVLQSNEVRRHATTDSLLPQDYVVVPDATLLVLDEVLWMRYPKSASASRMRNKGAVQRENTAKVSVTTLLLIGYGVILLFLSDGLIVFARSTMSLLLSAVQR
jgi:hypothetical protein